LLNNHKFGGRSFVCRFREGEDFMVRAVIVENRARLPLAVFDALQQVVQTQHTMERALAWFFAVVPSLAPEDIVAQDEFSYDLLVPYPGGLYLSYDTS
jgi:hypothetical protein